VFKLTSHGSFSNTQNFLRRVRTKRWSDNLKAFAEEGLSALRVATPKDTGETAASWSYEIVQTDAGWQLAFNNSKVTRDGVPVAILLQYGHGLKNGSYVRGIDFINPALKPVFEKMAEELWNEVNK
jgi:hypothetical protein